MQKLSNIIIDLEKEKEAQKSYKPYYGKREDNNQFKTPPHGPVSMNLTKVGKDNFCTFHQQPHSEKNCPQWINSMALVMNQLLDSKLTEDNSEEGKDNNKSTEKQEDEAMVLWDCVSVFDAEEEKDLRHEGILETNVMTRSQGLIKENNLMLPKIKRLQKNAKKFQNSSQLIKFWNLP